VFNRGIWACVSDSEHISKATISERQFIEFPQIHSTGNE
jgi:hypothetical protein